MPRVKGIAALSIAIYLLILVLNISISATSSAQNDTDYSVYSQLNPFANNTRNISSDVTPIVKEIELVVTGDVPLSHIDNIVRFSKEFGNVSTIEMKENVNKETANDCSLDTGGTPLLRAIIERKLDVAKQLLEVGADPDKSCDPIRRDSPNDKPTESQNHILHTNAHLGPIFFAAKFGYYEAAELLIKFNVNVNVRNENGLMPLHIALSAEFEEVSMALIRAGSDVSAPLSNDITPLMMASLYGMYHAAQLLIDRGADVNDASLSGDTALMYACTGGNLNIVDVLLRNGAEVGVGNLMQSTALMLAASRNRVDVIRKLVQFIHQAANKNKAHALQIIDAKDKSQRTALDIAISKDYQGVIDELISGGATMGKKHVHVSKHVLDKRQEFFMSFSA